MTVLHHCTKRALFLSYGSDFEAKDFPSFGEGEGNPRAADRDRPPWTEGGVGSRREGEGHCGGIGAPHNTGVTLSRSGGGGGRPAGDALKNALFCSVHCANWFAHVCRPGIPSIGMGAGVIGGWGGRYCAWGWARRRPPKPAAAA